MTGQQTYIVSFRVGKITFGQYIQADSMQDAKKIAVSTWGDRFYDDERNSHTITVSKVAGG